MNSKVIHLKYSKDWTYFLAATLDCGFSKMQYRGSSAALQPFWDLEITVLDEIHVSGTVVSPLLTQKSPTYTYISQKPW